MATMTVALSTVMFLLGASYSEARRWPSNGALFAAISQNRPQALRRALESGADPNAWHWGHAPFRRPLHLAARDGNPELVRALLEHGAEVDRPDMDRTPLEISASRHRLSAAEALLDSGADLRASRPTLISRLLVDAIDARRLPLVKKLAAAGADINAPDNRGATPLKAATGSTDPRFLFALLHSRR